MDKATFNGATKRITILPGFGTISVKTDLYSAWKAWLIADSNAQYLPAFRTIGGDPVGAGRFAGDIYFLINGWQIQVNHPIEVFGDIYHDDGIPVFLLAPSASVISTVSAVVNTVSTGGSTLTPEDVWNYMLSTAPAGSAADKLKQALTTGNFIALK